MHDASSFVHEHPGGAELITRRRGTDATAAFCGGVYDHSNAAHNVRLSRSRSPTVFSAPLRHAYRCRDCCLI